MASEPILTEKMATIDERSKNNQRDIERLFDKVDKGFSDLRKEIRADRIWISSIGGIGFAAIISILVVMLQKL